MATGQNFSIGNGCGKAKIKLTHHEVTVTRNGQQEPVATNMKVGNFTQDLDADVALNLPGHRVDAPGTQSNGELVTKEPSQCSEDVETSRKTSDNGCSNN